MHQINPNSKWYRFVAIVSSIKALRHLSSEQVHAFLSSYGVYNYDWVKGLAICDAKQMDYPEVKENILNWYGVLSHLCAIGEVEKMYIPPALNLEQNIIQNQLRFEERFCQLLGIKASDHVLELGCGKGRVAAHVASMTQANITGINIDPAQLNSATLFSAQHGLSKQCHFINKDFNELPFSFADQQFDHVYEIQALSLSRDLKKLFKELHRVLKPGGKVSLLEWVRLPKYDAKNPEHVALMQKIKPLIGAIGTPSPAEYETALRQAGFSIVVSEDPSIHQSQAPLIEQADRYFNQLMPLIKGLIALRIFPQYFVALFQRLSQDGAALLEAVQLGLVTTCYHIVAQKQ